MRKKLLLLSILLISAAANAQKEAGKKNILLLCGCFDVEFKYAETFAPDDDYKYHHRERITQAMELVVPVEQSDKKIVLQHLLIVNDTMVIKHWREDWDYEYPVLFKYTDDKVWEKQQLTRTAYKNRWTQTVWEVSDAPRYQGVSEWVNTDNKTFWMNTTDAPLPRREYTKRRDYNILKRKNTIYVTPEAWIHDQDNQKIIRNAGKDTLLAEEKGVNTYTRISENKCNAAKVYWEKNKSYWDLVRKIWNRYLDDHTRITVKSLVEGKPLHQYLSDIEEEVAEKKTSLQTAEIKIKSALELFVSDTVSASMGY